MRLNVFSPLPPQKSGIAFHVAALLPDLARRAEVTLWTSQERWDSALQAHAEVRRFSTLAPPLRAMGEADLNVYHLGNHAGFHADIWSVSRRWPGLVVLHDLHLQHLFAGVYRARNDGAGYLAQMRRWHGARGAERGRAFWDCAISTEALASEFPLFGPAVAGCLGALVHSPQAYEALAALGEFPVAFAELPHPAGPRPSRGAGPGGTRRLVAFGYIGPNRRIEPLLEALAGLEARAAFRLDLCGELWDPDHIARRVAELGLQGQVAVHGFVTEAQLDEVLAQADLAINLRFPSMGEASLSQLRIWDHALPSLVMRTGWYATLPEEAVAFVDPGEEVADLRRHLEALLAEPARFRAMGEAGRRRLESVHTQESYLGALMALARDSVLFGPSAAALLLSKRAALHISEWAGGEGAAASARDAAREIAALAASGARPRGPEGGV